MEGVVTFSFVVLLLFIFLPCLVLFLRTLLVNLLNDIPDTWPILVVSTWEDNPNDGRNERGGSGGGGGALGVCHNLGMGGLHGTMEKFVGVVGVWRFVVPCFLLPGQRLSRYIVSPRLLCTAARVLVLCVSLFS